MRTVILLPLCILLSISLSAQVSLGIKGGLNMAKVNDVTFLLGSGDKVVQEHEWHPLIHAGVWGQIQVNKDFVVQPELLYTHKAWSFQEPDGFPEEDFRVNLRYLTLPLIIRYQYKKIGLGFGPELSFQLHNDNHILIDTKQFELGFTGDVSWKFGDKWTVNARYSRDLSPFTSLSIASTSGAPSPGTAHYKNRTFQLALSYTLFSWKT